MPSDGGSESGRDGSSDGRGGLGGFGGGGGGDFGPRNESDSKAAADSLSDSLSGYRAGSSLYSLATKKPLNLSTPAISPVQPTAQNPIDSSLNFAKKAVGVATNVLGIASGNPLGIASGVIGLAEAAKGLFGGVSSNGPVSKSDGVNNDRSGNDNGRFSIGNRGGISSGAIREQIPRGENKTPANSPTIAASNNAGGNLNGGGYIASENTTPVVVAISGIDIVPIVLTIGAAILFGG